MPERSRRFCNAWKEAGKEKRGKKNWNWNRKTSKKNVNKKRNEKDIKVS